MSSGTSSACPTRRDKNGRQGSGRRRVGRHGDGRLELQRVLPGRALGLVAHLPRRDRPAAGRHGPADLSPLERQVESFPRAVQIPMTETEYLLLENRRQDLNGNGRSTSTTRTGTCVRLLHRLVRGSRVRFLHSRRRRGVGNPRLSRGRRGDRGAPRGQPRQRLRGAEGLDVVEADGIEDLDGPPSGLSDGSPDDVFREGWRDRLTPSTTPSTAA